jgi:hypothetical protein
LGLARRPAEWGRAIRPRHPFVSPLRTTKSAEKQYRKHSIRDSADAVKCITGGWLPASPGAEKWV